MLTRFRKIAYIIAYAVATIPLWHYIRDGRILALMVAVIAFAYLNVVLSTVEAAQPILSSEKSKSLLPRWLPDKPKYQKWWMLIRHTLKWHLLLIPPKMGLSLAVVYYLYSQGLIRLDLDIFGWLNSSSNLTKILVFKPYIYYNWVNGIFIHAYPQWETIFIATILSLCFAIVGCFLTSATVLNILSSKVSSEHKRIFLLVKHTCVVTFGILGFLLVFTGVYDRNVSYPCEPERGEFPPRCSEEVRSEQFTATRRQKHYNVLVGETVNISIFTFIDNGILLNANVMRPQPCPEYPDIVWDNRPFVARQIVAGMLGLLLYAGATWVVLWFVEDEVQRE